ncbi:uncharacterized protein K460DRAFT_274502 [Cucurbitaria berberidis CBS 394.84]|uniref:Uncharacterized protein n=1 Tax=Cucurbitaria berberidis CBS 394.84 TaxID=1168544 RepID=A0A9P4LD67_9PLEO|nr:uncharacterized protein K460DRAFT_274502 [Cucurbitaria berberidis CBS 394.84]KAF1850478.1 hypothetical protein K460DRAFT_274502 [Cucurbitaria berberidis CBS 394.84]
MPSNSAPPRISNTRPEATQPTLVLHTAVDYTEAQGVGIGIIQRAQRAQCATTSTPKPSLLRPSEHKYSIKAEDFAAQNVETRDRALMLALLHALGLAHSTLKQRASLPKTVQLHRVSVLCTSLTIVQLVQHHITHAPESLEDVACAKDCVVIQRVVEKVRKLSRRGIEVSIGVSSSEDGIGEMARPLTWRTTRRLPWQRVRILARQKGRQACRSRCRQLKSERLMEREQCTLGDEVAIQRRMESLSLRELPSESVSMPTLSAVVE